MTAKRLKPVRSPRRISTHKAVASAADYALESLDARRMLSAGSLDTTFNTTGKVTDNTLPAVQAVAVQADGKVVEVGNILGNFSVARFNADGTPDASFGFQGRLITDIGGADNPTSVAIQSDGKIVVAGTTGTDAATVRYNTDGQLDNSFGTGGIVKTHFAVAISAQVKAAIRSDGKIVVVVGNAVPVPALDVGYSTARLNPNGTPDAGYGAGGQAAIDSGFGSFSTASALNGMALQSDGKILVVGGTVDDGGGHILLKGFNADGTLDSTTFATPSGPGIFATTIGTAIAVQADGGVVVTANSSGGLAGGSDTFLFRDNANGTADANFGTAGVIDVRVDSPLAASKLDKAVYIQGDGKIVVGGQYITGGDFILVGQGDFFTTRYLANGAVDSTYGSGGTSTVDAPGADRLADGTVTAIAQAPGGATILAGGNTELGLARLTGDGGAVIPPGESPFSGSAAPVPGRIEAENFDNGGEGVAYHTSNPANFNGNVYRTSGITVENIPTGGFNVGFLHAGDFLNYSVNGGATGNYDFSARVADAGAGAAFHVEVDGVNVTGKLAIPDTGGYQSYQTIAKTGIPLSAGAHIVKLVFESNNAFGFAGNINWFQFDPSAAASTGNISGTVFHDHNNNAMKDPGDEALSGQFVFLDLQGIGTFVAGDPSAITDGSGNYTFAGLTPKAYIARIVLVPAPGFNPVLSLPSEAVFHSQYFIQLGSGATVTGKDFGIFY